MSWIWLILYNLLGVPAIYAGFIVGSLFNSKIKEGLKSRKGIFKNLSREIKRANGRKKILFHCTSAGEWLQALPVIEKMKEMKPDLFVMVSFFSPSGYRFSKNSSHIDLKFYLPLDSYFGANRLFKIVKPDLWIISKFDIWPNHVMAASAKKIPIVITSATLSADSRRDKGISRGFNKLVYNKISHIFAISEDDKYRFQAMVPEEHKYTVAGDTRYDHVYNRGMQANSAGDVKIFSQKPEITFIAGSTWPGDEKNILPALARLNKDFPGLHMIIVPHELHENHLRDIEIVFEKSGIATERYSQLNEVAKTATARIVIFNTVGLLARLYKQTDIAYIGGSFGRGIHNVMEPSIFGQPVLFGPNYQNSHEAGELLKAGAAITISDEQTFYEHMSMLIKDPVLRKTMGEKAKNLIQNNTGATAIIINMLKKEYDLFS
jgi:3-deoxy-D-manno-octulosonic-acid transferase